jgi:hypothetical protein
VEARSEQYTSVPKQFLAGNKQQAESYKSHDNGKVLPKNFSHCQARAA